ncbi:MAG: hypothetical protein Q9160_008651 [Pyrenula sp. 1 TL-2023]
MNDLAAPTKPKKFEAKLENPPADLKQAYDNSMSRIREQKGDASRYGTEVLYTLCLAKTPIMFDQLQCLLSLEEHSESLERDDYVLDTYVIGSCAGLVILDDETKVVRFGHETTQAYLHKHHSAALLQARSLLVKKCLVYLRFAALRLEFWSKNQKVRNLINKHPFLDYAAVYWGDHARDIGNEISEDLSADIMDLLKKPENLACATRVLLFMTSSGWISRHQWGAWGAEQKTKDKMRSINLAAFYGLDNVLARILDQSPEAYLGSSDPFGNVIHWAARGNHKAVMNRLMGLPQIQRIINRYSELAHTPLHVALVFRSTCALEILLENGADPTMKLQRDPDWHSLELAIWHGPPKHVEILLETGKAKTLLWTRDILRRLALNTAAESQETEALERLLPLYANDIDSDHNVDELVDALSRNALHQAAQSGHQHTTEVILNHKLGQIFSQRLNYRYQTPFQVAAFTGRLRVVKTYLQQVKREQLLAQKQALTLAALRGHSEVLSVLLDFFSSSPDAQDLYRYVLPSTIDNGRLKSVEDLTKRIHFTTGDTALREAILLAAPKGHVEVVRHLLSIGAPIDVQDGQGSTLLHLATSNRMSSVVRVLSEERRLLNMKDHSENTPLVYALQNKDVASSKLLLRSGVEIPQLDDKCTTWLKTQSWWARYSMPLRNVDVPKQLDVGSDGIFLPSSPCEIFQAACCLNKLFGKDPKMLPIVSWILELAEYWIATDTQRDGQYWFDENDFDPVYLRSLPITGRTFRPVRRIVLNVTSHDQSPESGHGDFSGYTWFTIERDVAGQRSDRIRLLKNKTRRREWTTFKVSWPHRDGFDRTPTEPHDAAKERWLQRLSRGDRLLLIPKAGFQDWRNYVRRAEVTVYSTCLRKVIYRSATRGTKPYQALNFAA